MMYFIIIIIVIYLAWVVYKHQQSASEGRSTTDIRINQTHPYGNDYIKLEVVSNCNYIRVDIAGIGYLEGIDKCVGEFDGTLVPEPNNPHDPQAIKIMHPNGTHVGYVPHNYEGDRLRCDVKLPCTCHCIILPGEKGYYGICVVPDNI